MKQVQKEAPLARFVDLSTLSKAGTEIVIALKGNDLAALAQWIDVDKVERFEAAVTLKKLSQTRFTYLGRFRADVVQACVVTLYPVTASIEREFVRELYLASGKAALRPQTSGIDGALAFDSDEGPEEVPSPRYDIWVPLLEEFVLSINPYPRRGDVEFSGAEEPQAKPENPFAVLSRLTNRV